MNINIVRRLVRISYILFKHDEYCININTVYNKLVELLVFTPLSKQTSLPMKSSQSLVQTPIKISTLLQASPSAKTNRLVFFNPLDLLGHGSSQGVLLQTQMDTSNSQTV